MGSWNETCKMTGMPIMHGQPVVAFLVTNNVFSDRPEYDVVSLPIRGKYDDYGGVEEIDIPDWHTSALLGTFQLMELDKPVNQFHEIEFPCKTVDELTRLVVIREATLHQGKATLHLVMFHKEAYDKFLSMSMDERLFVSMTEGYIARSERLAGYKMDFVNGLTEIHGNNQTNQIVEAVSSVGNFTHNDRLAEIMSSEHVSCGWYIHRLAYDYAPPDVMHPLIDGFADAAVELAALTASMRALSIDWSPEVSGGQDVHVDVLRAKADQIVKWCDAYDAWAGE